MEVLKSWIGPRNGQSYRYDQALTALVLMMQYRFRNKSISPDLIRLVLDRLVSFQHIDGHFVFWSIGTRERGDSYNGPSAWAGLTFTYYLRYIDRKNVDEYKYCTEKLADFLLYCQDPRTKLIAINDVDKFYSTEHNIDTFFFFKDMARLSSRLDYNTIAGEIRTALMTYLWNDSKGTFDRGYHDTKDALDCSSWGAMFLLATGEPEMADKALQYADRIFASSSGNYPHREDTRAEIAGLEREYEPPNTSSFMEKADSD